MLPRWPEGFPRGRCGRRPSPGSRIRPRPTPGSTRRARNECPQATREPARREPGHLLERPGLLEEVRRAGDDRELGATGVAEDGPVEPEDLLVPAPHEEEHRSLDPRERLPPGPGRAGRRATPPPRPSRGSPPPPRAPPPRPCSPRSGRCPSRGCGDPASHRVAADTREVRSGMSKREPRRGPRPRRPRPGVRRSKSSVAKPARWSSPATSRFRGLRRVEPLPWTNSTTPSRARGNGQLGLEPFPGPAGTRRTGSATVPLGLVALAQALQDLLVRDLLELLVPAPHRDESVGQLDRHHVVEVRRAAPPRRPRRSPAPPGPPAGRPAAGPTGPRRARWLPWRRRRRRRSTVRPERSGIWPPAPVDAAPGAPARPPRARRASRRLSSSSPTSGSASRRT